MSNETTSTVTANFGHGTRTALVVHSTGAPRSAMPSLALGINVEFGIAASGITKLGARIGASSYSEAGAANANTALPTPSQLTLTPASYVCTVAPTTEAFHRTDPALVDLSDLLIDELSYPLETLLAYDSSIGLVKYWPTQASNRVGTSGAALTPTTLFNAYLQLQTQIGQTGVDAICWLDAKGMNDLLLYGLTTAASVFTAPVGYNQMFADLLLAQGYDVSQYVTSIGRLHLFLEPKPGALGTASSDTIAPMFIPAVGGLNGRALPPGVQARYAELAASLPGGFSIAPAYAIGWRKDPALTQVMLGNAGNQFDREIMTPAGVPISIVARGRNGQNLAIIDGFTSVVSIELNDNSVVGVRYAT